MNLTTDATSFRRKSREWFARGFVSQKEAKPEVVWTPFPEPKELRLEEALRGLRDLVLGFFVRENTREWAPATFYWALFRAFANLHELATRQGDLFWEVPVGLTVFHFGWDASSPSVPRLVVNGRGPHEVLSAARLSVETMTEEERELHFQAMLAGALHGAAPPGYRRDVGDSYAVHIPQSVKDALEKLPPEEREAEGWRRVSPFTMGAREFRPRESYGEPKTLRDPIPPPVSVRGDEVDGKPLYEVATFVELGQVVVEPGETGAHFPMLVGFTLSPDSAHPSTWPESERASFWPALFSALEASLRENVPNADKVPVSPHVTTTNLEPFFRSSVDLSFASSSLLSEDSGLVRLPVEKAEDEEPVDEPPILVGIATETKSGGETVNVAVAGGALFVVRPPSPTGEKVSGPSETEIGMGHAGAIVSAARAIGVEVPEAFVFSAGQVFYKDRKLVEVRLSGFVNARLRDNGAGDGEIEASPWSTPVAPTLTADAEGVLSLAPADAGRTHLSAMVVRTANEPLAISLVWDLRENATPSKASASLEAATLAATGTVSRALARTTASLERTLHELASEKPAGSVVRVLRDAPTRYDRGALHLVHGLASLKLPRKLASVPSWEKLCTDEIQRLQDEEGDVAYKDLRKDPNGRAALLRRVTRADGTQETRLTEEGKRSLLERWSNRWFRQTQKDEDGVTREYVVRHLPVRGGGHLEARFTLYGQAWPLVEDAREDFESQARARLAPPPTNQTSLPLYDAAEEKIRNELESRLQFIRAVKDAHVLMRAILAEFGATGRNPVEKPLHELRHLLGYEKDPDGPRKVRGALRALSELRFRLEASGVDGFNGKTFGSFVAEVEERRRGKGEHVDGEVLIHLAPSAIGGLRVFSLGAYQVKEPKKLLFDWNKTLSKEDKETSSSEPYLRSFSKLAPYYDRHLGLTVSQTKLREWLEHNVTRNKDGVTKERASLRRRPGAADANAPRLYDRSFCPALPEGETFVAALGHYEARKGGGAERGRKLAGSATPPAVSGKSGGREGGLLHVMGYELPKNRSASQRQEVTLRALQDMKCVVEDHFKGAVVARRGSEWLRLEDATDKLSVEELLSEVSWFFFLPPDWLAHMHATYNALQEERFKRGETDAIYKMVPADAPEAPGERPLRERLRKAMADRGLSGAKVAEVFGVSRMAVSKWLATEPGKGSPIAEALVPLVERWIATGEIPTKDELAAIRKPGGGKGGRPSQNADA